MASNSDIIIVGGGAVGAACARELATRGRKVLIIEPGTEMGQAWRAAAGMLAPQIEADGSDPLLDLALHARDHYDGLAAELGETTGIDLGLWREGIARVALDQADAESLRLKVDWQKRQGLPCEWLGAPELRDRWPWLGPAVGALWAPRDGALDPERLVEALLKDARRKGATLIRDRIVGVDSAGSRVSGVIGEREHYRASQVVIAAGAWAGQMQGLPAHHTGTTGERSDGSATVAAHDGAGHRLPQGFLFGGSGWRGDPGLHHGVRRLRSGSDLGRPDADPCEHAGSLSGSGPVEGAANLGGPSPGYAGWQADPGSRAQAAGSLVCLRSR